MGFLWAAAQRPPPAVGSGEDLCQTTYSQSDIIGNLSVPWCVGQYARTQRPNGFIRQWLKMDPKAT